MELRARPSRPVEGWGMGQALFEAPGESNSPAPGQTDDGGAGWLGAPLPSPRGLAPGCRGTFTRQSGAPAHLGAPSSGDSLWLCSCLTVSPSPPLFPLLFSCPIIPFLPLPSPSLLPAASLLSNSPSQLSFHLPFSFSLLSNSLSQLFPPSFPPSSPRARRSAPPSVRT